MEFAQRLSEMRKERGLTQAVLAEKVGVSRQSVSKWESGLTFPEVEKLQLLCACLGVTVEEMLGQEKAAETEAPAAPESLNVVPAKPMHISLFVCAALSALLGILCISLIPQTIYQLDASSVLLVDGNWIPVTVGIVLFVMGVLVYQNRTQLAPTLPRLISRTCLAVAAGVTLIGGIAFVWNYAKIMFFDVAQGVSTPPLVAFLCALPYLLGIAICAGQALWTHLRAK